MKAKTFRSAVRDGSKDATLLAGIALVIAVLQRVRRGQSVALPALHTVWLSLAILVVTWMAIVIACRLGASTMSDSLGGERSGLKSRVPGTLAVGAIVGMVTFVGLLFAGLVE